jgi:hypothetical protein
MRKDEEVLTKKLLFNGIFSFSECGGLMISVCRRTEATWKKATDSKFVIQAQVHTLNLASFY